MAPLIHLVNNAPPPAWYNNPAERLEAIIDLADKVDTSPSIADIDAFLALIMPLWPLPIPAHQSNALAKVVGVQVGGVYVGGFLRNAGPLEWQHFSRETVALQLIVRIVNIRYIQQKNHPLCGPVSFMHDIARQDREAYVDYVIGLAEHRHGTIGALNVTVRAGSPLLGKHANAAHIGAADYIALASLRDSGNVLGYRSAFTNRTLEGATTPSAVMKWMTAAGYTNVEDHTHTMWRFQGLRGRNEREAYAEIRMQRNVTKMQHRLNNGDTVLMFASGNLAHTALNHVGRDPVYLTMFGGHFMLVTQVAISLTGVTFHIISWGQELVNPPEIRWTKIASWYKGFVSGHP